ncbi:TatD family hydrolase [Irregularibacter muris]|uniref:TatD family hydrolase n=1 Tax=Irregularibacter muris TaxID=1796619 RepID=A0AAE3L093_9FIRM|nr:TatD family hydrolase [Irregularibacter muris]MCR1899522.1 TatD family hydrolase [Irregularibacter muris]
MYFDSHAHLNDERFHEDRKQLIQEAIQENISYILNPGADLPSSKEAVMLAEKHDFIYAAVGVHPHDAKTVEEDSYKQLEELARHPKVKAIGEIGLDYYYDNSPREVQKQVFQRQIKLASKLDLPIIIHNRDAHEDTYHILEQHFRKNNGGVMHSYSGSVEMAQQFIALGLYLSISGPVTFKNARKAVEVVEKVPLDKLLIETDSPYLTPLPFRGKKNHPALVKYVAQKIAEIKNITVEEVAQQTTRNAKELFRID